LGWLRNNLVALEAYNSKNNIHTWYMVQLVSIEQYLNPTLPSPELSKLATNFFKSNLPKQIDKNSGNQPFESKRANPLHYLAFNMQAILFLAELANDIASNICNPSGDRLILLAMNYITTFAENPKEDITQAVRCAEIIFSHDSNNLNCKKFIDIAYHCKFADKIGGPKNAINALWSSF
jgi:hypothetical protein